MACDHEPTCPSWWGCVEYQRGSYEDAKARYAEPRRLHEEPKTGLVFEYSTDGRILGSERLNRGHRE